MLGARSGKSKRPAAFERYPARDDDEHERRDAHLDRPRGPSRQRLRGRGRLAAGWKAPHLAGRQGDVHLRQGRGDDARGPRPAAHGRAAPRRRPRQQHPRVHRHGAGARARRRDLRRPRPRGRGGGGTARVRAPPRSVVERRRARRQAPRGARRSPAHPRPAAAGSHALQDHAHRLRAHLRRARPRPQPRGPRPARRARRPPPAPQRRAPHAPASPGGGAGGLRAHLAPVARPPADAPRHPAQRAGAAHRRDPGRPRPDVLPGGAARSAGHLPPACDAAGEADQVPPGRRVDHPRGAPQAARRAGDAAPRRARRGAGLPAGRLEPAGHPRGRHPLHRRRLGALLDHVARQLPPPQRGRSACHRRGGGRRAAGADGGLAGSPPGRPARRPVPCRAAPASDPSPLAHARRSVDRRLHARPRPPAPRRRAGRARDPGGARRSPTGAPEADAREAGREPGNERGRRVVGARDGRDAGARSGARAAAAPWPRADDRDGDRRPARDARPARSPSPGASARSSSSGEEDGAHGGLRAPRGPAHALLHPAGSAPAVARRASAAPEEAMERLRASAVQVTSNVSPSSPAPTTSRRPASSCPASTSSAIGSCISRWMVRRRGRAPYAGSKPLSAR